jgi:IS1 family transposase
MVVRAAGPECGSGAVHDHWPYPPWQTASSMESVRATGGGHCRRSYHCRRATAPDCTRAAGAHLAPRKLPCRGGSLPWLLHVMVDRLAACPAVLHVRGPPRPTDAVLRRLEAAADARGSVVKTRANQPWIGIAMEAQLRQVLALHVGDRRRDQAKERWAKRPLGYQAQAICHPDHDDAYTAAIPAGLGCSVVDGQTAIASHEAQISRMTMASQPRSVCMSEKRCSVTALTSTRMQ